jgi:hypothetical protein
MFAWLNRLSRFPLSASAGLFCLLAATGQPVPSDRPKTAPALPAQSVIAAWRDAGATVGWMRSQEGIRFFRAKYKGEIDELPAFELFLYRNPLVLAELPAPTNRRFRCRA